MTPRRRRRLIFALVVGFGALFWFLSGPIASFLGVSLHWATSDRSFLFKPYLQLGNSPELATPERAEVVWHTADVDADWWVEVRTTPSADWVRAPKPEFRRIVLEKVEPHRTYHATISGLVPGEKFNYRVGRASSTLFESEGRARMPEGRPYRTAIIGDIAAGTSAASHIAWQIGESHPDFLVIAGDIVYSRGRISEYADRFFPVYNADTASRSQGAPILRSILSAAAPGNHDISPHDMNTFPDLMAYFFEWSQPLNGPTSKYGDPSTPALNGSPERVELFLESAGPTFPRMCNFSFDNGDVHWTVLDTNPNVDWSDPALRAWVEHDLAAAKAKPWRLVLLHQPGFNSSVAHYHEQQARELCDIFERGGVSIVFGGHVHNYQRTKPLTFKVQPQPDGKLQGADGHVNGGWTLDDQFDGVTKTEPTGVIYIISGAGGATLHDTIRGGQSATWAPFTQRVISDIHSFTLLDISPAQLKMTQIDVNGKEVDSMVVTRPANDSKRSPAPPQ